MGEKVLLRWVAEEDYRIKFSRKGLIINILAGFLYIAMLILVFVLPQNKTGIYNTIVVLIGLLLFGMFVNYVLYPLIIRKKLVFEYIITDSAIKKFPLFKKEKERLELINRKHTLSKEDKDWMASRVSVPYLDFWSRIGWPLGGSLLLFSISAIKGYYQEEEKIIIVPKVTLSSGLNKMVITPKNNKKEILEILKNKLKKPELKV